MENYKIVMIVGLPRSGKTTLAEALKADSPESTLLADDLSKHNAEYVSAFDATRFNRIIVTDPHLCGVPQDSAEHTMLEMFGLIPQEVEFEWIYFENEPEACLTNAELFPRVGGVSTFIRELSKKYTIPEDSVVMPVYRVLH